MNTYLSAVGSGGEVTWVVIDHSGSSGYEDILPTRLAAEQEATCALLDLKHSTYPADCVGVIGFGSDAHVVHPLAVVGTHGEALKRAVRAIEVGGSTNMRAALRLVSSGASRQTTFGHLRALFAGRESLRSAGAGSRGHVILLSDGRPDDSPVAVATELKNAGYVISTIGISGSRDADHFDEKLLQRLSSSHDDGVTPRYWHVTDRAALVERVKALSGHIRPRAKEK